MADILAQAEAARVRGLLLAREKACYLYTSALDAGDLGTVATVLAMAEHDAILDSMLVEIDLALWEEMLNEQEQEGADRATGR